MGKKNKKFDHDGPDRKFMIELYPDSDAYSFDEVLTKVLEYAPEWAYIYHDRDVGENDEIMKKHCLIAVRFPSPRTRKAIANVIGITPNYIVRWDSFKKACRYLIHADNPEKTPYHEFEVECNFDYLKLTNVQESECVKVSAIMEFIRSKDCRSLVDVAEFAINNNIWSEYRRSYAVLKDYYKEIKEMQRSMEHDYQECCY